MGWWLGDRCGVVAVASVAAAVLAGCASPGLPKPPSLQLPALVDDLTATRRGDAVELRFTLPNRTTDGFALKSATVSATVCRAIDAGRCEPLAATAKTFPTPLTGMPALAELRDALPAPLASGEAHLLTYRVELANSRGNAGGYSQPAYAASGSAPPAVSGLSVQGSRLGVVVSWAGDGQQDERVVLRRKDLQAAKGEAPAKAPRSGPGTKSTRGDAKREVLPEGVVMLDAHDDSNATNATLDDSAAVDEPYRYSAERRREVHVEGKTLELRSEVSAPVTFTLRDVFPPPAPQDLSVAGFKGTDGAFAVDLIWKPVEDPHLAGYNVYRESDGGSVKLNAALVTVPAFHDAGASAGGRYRYRVTAVDGKGNESAAGVMVLEPQ